MKNLIMAFLVASATYATSITDTPFLDLATSYKKKLGDPCLWIGDCLSSCCAPYKDSLDETKWAVDTDGDELLKC